jgi:ketosteroid isomerase-like protein
METTNFQKRLKHLEDIQEIKDLHREYVYWVNSCEWDKVLDCFTEDAFANIGKHGPRKGKTELEKLFKVDIANNNQGKGRDGHFVIQPVISADGDIATGHWLMYIMIADKETGKAERWSNGRHDAEYERFNGKWKIKNIIWTRPWPVDPVTHPKVDEK